MAHQQGAQGQNPLHVSNHFTLVHFATQCSRLTKYKLLFLLLRLSAVYGCYLVGCQNAYKRRRQEIAGILLGAEEHPEWISEQTVQRPRSEALFLFNRAKVGWFGRLATVLVKFIQMG
jgi:hypothetical protein